MLELGPRGKRRRRSSPISPLRTSPVAVTAPVTALGRDPARPAAPVRPLPSRAPGASRQCIRETGVAPIRHRRNAAGSRPRRVGRRSRSAAPSSSTKAVGARDAAASHAIGLPLPPVLMTTGQGMPRPARFRRRASPAKDGTFVRMTICASAERLRNASAPPGTACCRAHSSSKNRLIRPMHCSKGSAASEPIGNIDPSSS